MPNRLANSSAKLGAVSFDYEKKEKALIVLSSKYKNTSLKCKNQISDIMEEVYKISYL